MVTVNIPTGVTTVTTDSPLFQWDYGQKLRITGDNLPATCQVHFCDRTCAEAIVRVASVVDVEANTLEVTIPDSLLENEHTIHAFIYVIETGTGYTIKQITIPVLKRTKPSAQEDPVPEVLHTELEQLILNINGAMEGIEEIFDEALTVDELKLMIDESVNTKSAAIQETANSAVTTANNAVATANSAVTKANQALGQTATRKQITNTFINMTLNEGVNEKGEYIINATNGAGEYEVEIEVTNISTTSLQDVSHWNGIHTLKGYLTLKGGQTHYLICDGWRFTTESYLALKVECISGSNYTGQLTSKLTLMHLSKRFDNAFYDEVACCTGIIRGIYKRVTG